MRKLASIQRIVAIRPIPGADLIEAADVLGWTVVVKRGDFQVGDLAVYFEIDSFLNASDTRYASFEDRFINWDGKRGMRLKTVKLRKQISQGLLLRREDFVEIPGNVEEGTDVTEILSIEKWEAVEERTSNAGGIQKTAGSKPFPSFIRKTDQERIQNCVNQLARHMDETFEVSVKLDGSSMTVYHVSNSSPHFAQIAEDVELRELKKLSKFQRLLWKFKRWAGFTARPKFFQGVCSRNIDLGVDSSNHFSAFVRDNTILEELSQLGGNYAFQGELIGPGIQSNYEQVDNNQFYVYQVWLIDQQKYAEPEVARDLADLACLNYVKVLDKSAKLSQFGDVLTDPRGVVDAILAFAEGPSMNPAVKREGIVMKSNESDFSAKAISQSYLLAGK